MFVDMASRRRRQIGGSPDPSVAVEAALAGTGGFALDLSDTTRMWQQSAKTTLVSTAGQFIGAVDSRFGAARTFTSASGRLPAWNGVNAGDHDGSDDRLDATGAALGLLNNKPAFFACIRFYVDSPVQASPISIASGTAGESRAVVLLNSDGTIIVQFRNVDGGTITSLTSATGVVSAGQDTILTVDCDYAGTRAIRVFVNGTQVISGSLVQAAGNTSATNSNAFYIGRGLVSRPFNGKIARSVFADKLMTAGEIANIEAWVGQGALA